MSPSIWTRCGGRTSCGLLESEPWRVVEGQHLVATRGLVDSTDEHATLEELLDASKPAAPLGPEFHGLHYLLATPFRYPPLRHGSRFGTRLERGIWYGAEALPTALAETAYYRLLFFAGTTADLLPNTVEVSAFQAHVRTSLGVDLTREAFAHFAATLRSRTSYRTTQRLGREMRRDGVEAFRYTSARDPGGGACIGVFTPAAFASRRPKPATQNWYCTVTSAGDVEFTRHDVVHLSRLKFEAANFTVKGAIPLPAD
jgi:hypothetical protein